MDNGTAMLEKHIDTVVVGAGQAGLSASEHLTRYGCPHVILEQHSIGESWRNDRWDSLVSNGPAWHDRLPTLEIPGVGAQDFATAKQLVAYLELYAKNIAAPVRTGIQVRRVQRLVGKRGFSVETSEGTITCRNIIAASGTMRTPRQSTLIPKSKDILQLHSCEYRNPDQLNPGATLVVGSGSSGTQIAVELMVSGRTVYLSLGQNMRPPRSYRGMDFAWWSSVLGMWDATPIEGQTHTTIAVSGAHISQTIDYRKLNAMGMRLVGQTSGFENGNVVFRNTLKGSIDYSNLKYLESLKLADEYIMRNGLDLPDDPDAWYVPPITNDEMYPIRRLNLKDDNIRNIIWSHGFQLKYDWIDVDEALKDDGSPIHTYGISPQAGLYFLGLPWQINRSSSFLWGEWNDAAFIAKTIWYRGNYWKYSNPEKG